MKMTKEEKISLNRLAHIFHESGMSKKEAEILMRSLGTIENLESLLMRLETFQKVDREQIYFSLLEVELGTTIPKVNRRDDP